MTNRTAPHGIRRVPPQVHLALPLAALLAAGCPQDKPQQSGDKPGAGATAAAAKVPPAKQAPPAAQAKAEPPVYYSGAHILIGYQGATGAKATRSKDEALALAKKVGEEARKAPGTFAELAKKYSEGPSGPAGGDLGVWQQGRMVKAFDEAIAKIKVGDVSDPVETPFGFHLIIRREVPAPIELAARQVIVAFKGSMMASPKVTRDKDAAKKLAEQLLKTARKSPDKFVALIKKHSDGPRAEAGGQLGPWHSLQSRMPPVFTNTVRVLKIGELSEVVETPFGFHIFQRMEIPPLLAGSHILVAYKGARRAAASITRSKAEALKIAGELVKELKSTPGKFVELAAKRSDGPSASSGGSLGTWRQGKMVPVFDEAILKLKVGEISDPVESPFGYHVIRRDAPQESAAKSHP